PIINESIDQAPTLTEENPIEIEVEKKSEPISEEIKSEDLPQIFVSKPVSDNKEPELIEQLPGNNAKISEFDETIQYNSSDYVKHDLQFSNSEIIAIENKIQAVEDEIKIENNLNLGSEPIQKSETVHEISSPTIPEPFSETPVVVETYTPFVNDNAEVFPKNVSELVENKPFDLVENPPVESVSNTPISANLGDLPPKIEVPPPIIAPSIPITSDPILGKMDDPTLVKAGESESNEARSYTNPIVSAGSGTAADTDGKNKTKLKPLEEGTVLNNRYEIIRKIGGGGMGAVYLASDKNLGGVLRAVKEMVQSYIEETQQDKAIADFKRESMLLTSLDHIAIPTIFDYFYDEKEARFYLVMKYISGGDLAGRMRAAPEGRLDEITVTDWAIQISDVLEYLHRHDPPIVYRDLKPSNIMLDGNSGKVMLIDFGIARWVNKEEKGVTAVGTMGYAPPELFSGNVEPRSDIYSLGSTMFHLLTGADPQSNPLLIFDFNKNPRPRQINSQLSDQIEQIVMRSVEYNAAQRFTSAAEMRDALQKHLDNLKRGSVTFGVSPPTSGMPMTGNLPVFCGFCGQKILATDMFCPFCGAQQPLAGQSQNLNKQPIYSTPKSSARLLIIGTNDLDNTEFSLEKDTNLVGRRDPMSNIFPEVDLSKYDPQTKISRKHARIWRENDLFMLEDLGSSNGTILISTDNNSSRLLPRQPRILANGDKIRVGDTTLRFTIS
ncbi:MAG TPA: protein kinase, partial [Pyrinomonadaceae bacterium]|nr:protein kinase [Pyrinomonadaceae bacterium]